MCGSFPVLCLGTRLSSMCQFHICNCISSSREICVVYIAIATLIFDSL
jgi:hypothetical protein